MDIEIKRGLDSLEKRRGRQTMTVRVVYLELNKDLSPDSFIMALRRFKLRRGHV